MINKIRSRLAAKCFSLWSLLASGGFDDRSCSVTVVHVSKKGDRWVSRVKGTASVDFRNGEPEILVTVLSRDILNGFIQDAVSMGEAAGKREQEKLTHEVQ